MSETEPEKTADAEKAEPTVDFAAGETSASQGDDTAESAAAVDIEALQEELATAKDNVVRATAEMQNVRRRAEKDVENARRYALEKMAKDILGVVDNLERTLDSVGEEKTPFTEGVELTLKSFIDVLGRQKIEQLNPVGEPFDPQLHEAISMVPNPDAEDNTVLNVAQKGYTLNGRVIRAAMVIVCKN